MALALLEEEKTDVETKLNGLTEKLASMTLAWQKSEQRAVQLRADNEELQQQVEAAMDALEELPES